MATLSNHHGVTPAHLFYSVFYDVDHDFLAPPRSEVMTGSQVLRDYLAITIDFGSVL